MSRRGATLHVFTAQDDAAMLDLRRQGYTFAKIALLLGFAQSSVGARVRMLGGQLPPSKLRRTAERASAREEGGQVARKSDTSGWCLCLGGCDKKFLSPDRLRIRVCPICRKKSAWQSGAGRSFSLSL